MDSMEISTVNTTPKFSSAIFITRPKSTSKSESPNQTKVAKLVLKPINDINNKSPPKRIQSTQSIIVNRDKIQTQSALDNLRMVVNNKIVNSKHGSSVNPRKNVELERSIKEDEKKTLKAHQQQQLPAASSHASNKSAMDETTRNEARKFIRQQREKRKMEATKKNEIDKSFIIKQRLEDLKRNTQNAITKNPKKDTKPLKLSSPRNENYYSLDNPHIKEIKVLKLKPTSAQHKLSPVKQQHVSAEVPEIHSPEMIKEAPKIINRPSSKPKSPLKFQNPPSQTDVSEKPSSAKENMRPTDDLKLKVPDVKLTMSGILNRTDVAPLSSLQQTFVNTQSNKIPFWLQNTVKPYPYNFIWAVRKKLEALTEEIDRKQQLKKMQSISHLETPASRFSKNQLKANKPSRGRKFPHLLSKTVADDPKYELHRPTMINHNESIEQEAISEAGTISEISSIKSDMVLVKSQSQDQESKKSFLDDDSGSVWKSLPNEAFVGKNREIITTEFDRSLIGAQIAGIDTDFISPNTTEKRNNFLTSTHGRTAEDVQENLTKTALNDLDSNKLNQEKEEEFQKMLMAFNKSLSHVVEVNHMLSTALINKSSKSSSHITTQSLKSNSTIQSPPHEAAKDYSQDYSSSFENNIESATKESDGTNISEMIENLVQKNESQLLKTDPTEVESNSSIQTLIGDSNKTSQETLKPEFDEPIEDPAIEYLELAQDFSSTTTKVTTTTTEIIHKNIPPKESSRGKGWIENHENTLNESRLLGIFRYSESEISFNGALMDQNEQLLETDEMLNKTELKSWEHSLIQRTRGQIAWLELQKQKCRKQGQLDKVSAIRKQQRAILMRLEKEREKQRENSERSIVQKSELSQAVVGKLDESMDTTGNDDARENIERILQQRESKIIKRRKQIEHLVNWQRKLDDEEQKLKLMEQELLGVNMKKLAYSPRKKKRFGDEDLLNTSIKMMKSIDDSLKILEKIKPSAGEEAIDVSGRKLNKLWFRLTGIDELKYQPTEMFHLTKGDLANFYEDAKETVLQSDLKILLEASFVPDTEPPFKNPAVDDENQSDGQNTSSESNVSTMNSIANIETEEEGPGSTLLEPSTENDNELHQMLANQMKIFVDFKKVIDEPSKIATGLILTPTIDNATFQVHKTSNISNDIDSSEASTVGVEEMDIELDSLIQTEPLISVDASSVDHENSIIPEISEIAQVLITDMDDPEEQQIEDISFPSLEASMAEETIHDIGEEGRLHDLSTITECTEYEQSQGSTDEFSSEIASRTSTTTPTTSERLNSEIEKRLISINDSLEGVHEAFKKVSIINRSPSTVTYSTDKDFVDSGKTPSDADTLVGSSEASVSQNLLTFSPLDSDSTKPMGSQIATSTPKNLMPDILSEVADG